MEGFLFSPGAGWVTSAPMTITGSMNMAGTLKVVCYIALYTSEQAPSDWHLLRNGVDSTQLAIDLKAEVGDGWWWQLGDIASHHTLTADPQMISNMLQFVLKRKSMNKNTSNQTLYMCKYLGCPVVKRFTDNSKDRQKPLQVQHLQPICMAIVAFCSLWGLQGSLKHIDIPVHVHVHPSVMLEQFSITLDNGYQLLLPPVSSTAQMRFNQQPSTPLLSTSNKKIS